jgi:hypothetical protein
MNNFIEATEKNGGATYNIKTKELNPEVGFAVGVIGSNYAITHGVEKCVNHFLNTFEDILDTTVDEHAWIGTWINNDLIHIDIVRVVDTMDEAMIIGRYNNQECVFDLQNKIEIQVNNTQKQ